MVLACAIQGRIKYSSKLEMLTIPSFLKLYATTKCSAWLTVRHIRAYMINSS
jgi:hypothetical protein